MVQAYRLEGSHPGLTVVRGDVVHSHAALALQPQVNHLGHALEAAVLGAEVDVGGPVVGEVLAERAGGAGRPLDGVVFHGSHGGVERIAAHDLVQMGRLKRAGGDKGVQAFDDELRALETHHCGLGGDLPQTERRRCGQE